MLSNIINFSIKNKFIVLLFTTFIIGFGLYSLSQIPIGAVPDVTNNQVQVITTSRNLSTQDMEQFITYPVELEMANLPGVQEIRSISKFGLSVVTIVFDDDMGTYLPRQLIAEKIKSASEKIPEGFGTPEMGPITTGLGEIYQYILDVKPEFKDQYNAQDLRTIQDWVVKRQLSGTPGVVEVNTWGGFLKQYEVAIDTKKLNAMNITANEVFTALEMNNSISGGGYIEKVNQAFFIRGEGLISSFEDINNIVVKNENNLPIYIKDVATVGFGSATRFGAITGNGEGEKVLGQVMMLKDANSKKVIDAVKERVEQISKSLPEGVYINAFLDRSELIAKTTFTVSENLILGCLIVIFVVVLLLGNFRSGLVVASVIPLCLLFALSLMYIFGVDANLMSLGAIDFGIIIDGAVIFVLLYFAFKSVKEALIIYSAIPLAAVGGVFLLWIRDLPFSISAGVGFIALFGIVVLNGIVLIEHFKELKKEGDFDSMEAFIKQGTKDRLRAVLLTAMAAALGFLPMAISTNAGAEVQRPLATVIIGGLITATILTLVVLPVLYAYFNSPKKVKTSPSNKNIAGLSVLFLIITLNVNAQDTSKNLDALISLAIENNAGLSGNRLEVDQSNALVNSAFSFDKTQVYYEFDENNLALNNEALRVFGIQQDFRFPTVYFSEKKVNQANVDVVTSSYEIKRKTLKRNVTSAYYTYQIAQEKRRVLKTLDSLYSSFSSIAARRFELGETNYLEKITAASKQKQIHIKYLEAQQNVVIAYESLVNVVQPNDTLVIAKEYILKLPLNALTVDTSAELGFYKNRIALLQAQRNFERQKLLPDISLNYFQGTNSGLNNSLYGYQFGVKIPLLFGGQSSRIKAAGIAEEVATQESNEYKIQLDSKLTALNIQLDQLSNALAYYEEEGAALSNEILKTANGSFRNGEIDFYQYIQSIESAYEVKLEYLNKLNEYNNIVIEINYLTL